MRQTAAPNPPGIPGIYDALRERLTTGLNQNLAALTDLMLAYKQAHWNVVGPGFAQLHALFDRFADETRAYVDLVAERAVALGGVAHGTVQAAADQTVLPPFSADERDERRLLEALVTRSDRLAAALRQAITDSAEEAVTQDLYIEVARGIEKQRWMLTAQLGGSARSAWNGACATGGGGSEAH